MSNSNIVRWAALTTSKCPKLKACCEAMQRALGDIVTDKGPRGLALLDFDMYQVSAGNANRRSNSKHFLSTL